MAMHDDRRGVELFGPIAQVVEFALEFVQRHVHRVLDATDCAFLLGAAIDDEYRSLASQRHELARRDLPLRAKRIVARQAALVETRRWGCHQVSERASSAEPRWPAAWAARASASPSTAGASPCAP